MAGRSKHFSVIRPYLPDEGLHPEEGAYERLTSITWKQHMDEAGLIEDDFHLRKVLWTVLIRFQCQLFEHLCQI